jgi:hypothetical protein
MKASELRIGNWYDDNGIFKQVTPNIIEEVWIAERNWVQPIQLTEEWLIKFGFTKYEWMDGCFIKTSFGDLMIQFFRDEIHLFFTKVSVDSKGMMFDGRRFAGDKKTFTKIQYLHQLQNLYFALTGEELTITEKMV